MGDGGQGHVGVCFGLTMYLALLLSTWGDYSKLRGGKAGRAVSVMEGSWDGSSGWLREAETERRG